MTKRFLPTAGALMALLVFAGMASGAGATKHKVSDTMAIRLLSGAGTPVVVFTGTIHDKAFGNGAVITRSTATNTAGTVNVTATAFFKAATVTIKGTDTAVARADGSGIDYSGSAKVVSGTGAMKGATGKVKFTGSSTSADPQYQTYKITGSLTY